jgi:small multidrug resistance family-3 protein
LHPGSAAGRTYAAYGGVYVATAVLWLWAVDGQRPDRFDVIGAAVCLVGMAIVYFGPRG